MSIISNIDVYWSIADEAHHEMRADLEASRSLKPDGELGYIILWDPDRRSFKNAMVAIVFAGMFLDALLYIALQSRLGRVEALTVDRLPHEERLKILGITDSVVLGRVQEFREARKDLVHEKAVEITEIGGQAIRAVQSSVDSAMELIREIRGLLGAP